MRILFLTFQFPYPPVTGAAIKSLSLLDYLRRDHDVCCISLRKGHLSAEQQEWAENVGGVRTVRLDKPRNARTLLSSYVARLPLRVERNRSAGMGRLVHAELTAFQPDALFCDGLSMSQYLPEGFTGLKILHEHNAEYVIWQRQSEIQRGPLRWLAALEASRLRRYEAAAVRRFDAVFVVSEDDRSALVGLGAGPARIGILPNIPERALLDQPAATVVPNSPVILYFGTLSWLPNIEGVERVLDSVFPAVRSRMPDARLVVAGMGAPRSLIEGIAGTEGAEYRGAVVDAEPLYQEASLLVDATRSGGGTRLKILNALARGIPVVASTIAAQGLDVVPGEHLLVAGNDEEMTDAIVLLLNDSRRRRILSENGRALIRARYVAEVAYRPLDNLLGRAPARAT